MQENSIQKQKRFTRNRNRSKRRGIFCPIHSCYLESTSPKYMLNSASMAWTQRNKRSHHEVITETTSQANTTTKAEWLESFWCSQCGTKQWFHVKELTSRRYEIAISPKSLCQQLFQGIDYSVGS